MKTYSSSHGPIAILTNEELSILNKAALVLEGAIKIESADGKLATFNYPEAMAARSSLQVFVRYAEEVREKKR